MSNDKKIGVALVHKICVVCGKKVDSESEILINQRLGKKAAQQVEEMNGQAVGFAEKLCEDCQKIVDEGACFIIAVDEEKTTDFNNPYREGHVVAIKKSSDFYQNLQQEFKKDVLYMDYKLMRNLGMIQNKL